MRLFFSLLSFLVALGGTMAQTGHQIRIKIDGYQPDTLLIAYHLSDKQYVSDTLLRGSDNFFTLQGKEPLKPGMYLAVMKPNNQYFQFLVTEKEQRFSMETNVAQQVGRMRVKNGPDNALFYEYLAYLDRQRTQADQLRKDLEAATDAKKKQSLQAELDRIDQEVAEYQQSLVTTYSSMLTAAIVRANLSQPPPDFRGTEEEVNARQWRWLQQHYFDNIDLTDERLLRTPFLFSRVDYFVNKLQVQHPDTLIRAIDYVLGRMRPGSENFKHFLVHFLNDAAGSKIIGRDAIYVHLVDKYYAKGMASWIDEEQLAKMIDNANTLRPILIGKTAPDLRMQRRDGSPISLSEVDAEYTILLFWAYDCGHCKKTTPMLKEFYDKYKGQGVKIFSVCTKAATDAAECWKYVDENELNDWIQVTDPTMRSRFGSLYDVRSTPKIYVLDRDKKIVSKNIGAEQLDELLQMLMEEKAQ